MNVWVPVLVAALSGSLLGAVIQVLSEPLRLRWQHQWNLKAEQEHARFADQRRRLSAHLAARDDYLSAAEEILRWTENVATETLGDDADYWDPEGTPGSPRKQLPSVLKDLRHLAATHPTQHVRRSARVFDESLRGFYGDITRQMHGQEFPSPEDRDHLLSFRDQAERLVESLHEPLALDEFDRAGPTGP